MSIFSGETEIEFFDEKKKEGAEILSFNNLNLYK
jgi:hypothetical protein